MFFFDTMETRCSHSRHTDYAFPISLGRVRTKWCL